MHVKLSHFLYEFKKGSKSEHPLCFTSKLVYPYFKGKSEHLRGLKKKSYGALGTLENVLTSVPDPDPDPPGSEIIWPQGSGSGSEIINFGSGSGSGSGSSPFPHQT